MFVLGRLKSSTDKERTTYSKVTPLRLGQASGSGSGSGLGLGLGLGSGSNTAALSVSLEKLNEQIEQLNPTALITRSMAMDPSGSAAILPHAHPPQLPPKSVSTFKPVVAKRGVEKYSNDMQIKMNFFFFKFFQFNFF